MLVRPVMKRLFFPWKTKEKKARFARAPHDNMLSFDYSRCDEHSKAATTTVVDARVHRCADHFTYRHMPGTPLNVFVCTVQ